jgi:hypothetical protein
MFLINLFREAQQIKKDKTENGNLNVIDMFSLIHDHENLVQNCTGAQYTTNSEQQVRVIATDCPQYHVRSSFEARHKTRPKREGNTSSRVSAGDSSR